ncbi:hypothetical protein FB451DRAFT_1082209 [Mycena latifolia]|nr:hypothetical protein FB451DRAFT_1082209 [Mycena latifolia]
MGDPLRDDNFLIGKGMTMSFLENPPRVRLHVTGEERFEAPRHWHRWHTEHHVVLKGRILITQDGKTRVLTPEDGACITPPGVVHSLQSFAGEEAILEETAMPAEANPQKALCFRNMFAPGVSESGLRMMQVFYYGDGYPELPFKMRWLEVLLVVVMGGWIAPLLGYELPDKRLRMDPKRFPPSKKD